MKLISKEYIHLDHEIPVYDIVNAVPYHNFILENGVVAHNCGIIDEVEFAKGANINMLKSGIMDMYRNIKRRMESRFMKQGKIPGMLFLVSSKKSEYDFLEQYAKANKDKPTIKIIDEPVWNVKPASNYSGKRFKVAVGNKFMDSKIITDKEDPHDYEKLGYELIDVPVEYHDSFDLDINSALMDIAGIATVSQTKFINANKLRENYSNRTNPFTMDVLTIGTDDDYQISDFFRIDEIPISDRNKPGFMHLDLSVSGDKTGISYVIIDGQGTVKRYDPTSSISGLKTIELSEETDLRYKQLFSVAIKAPADSEISFAKTRGFIYMLKSQGFNLITVTTDGFQSTDTRQQLNQAGIKSFYQSLDRTPEGYLTARTAINEKRIDLLDLSGTLVETELTEVEQGINGKVDHPQMGSKDTADSLVGSIWAASKSKIRDLSNNSHPQSDTAITSDLLEESSRQSLEESMFGQEFSSSDDITTLMNKNKDLY